MILNLFRGAIATLVPENRQTDIRLGIILIQVDERWLNMARQQIDQGIEQLCQKGCQSVREDIRLLERGVILPEIQDLDEMGRRLVLKELRSIMAVYGDVCPADRKIHIR